MPKSRIRKKHELYNVQEVDAYADRETKFGTVKEHIGYNNIVHTKVPRGDVKKTEKEKEALRAWKRHKGRCFRTGEDRGDKWKFVADFVAAGVTRVEMTIENGDGGSVFGRITYEDNLIVDHAFTQGALITQMKKALRDFHKIEADIHIVKS